MSGVQYITVGGSDWQWGEDYFFARATYTVACPPGRVCQVGMGVKVFGEPRGEKVRFSGEKKVVVVGAGALHFRVADNAGPCRIGFTRSKAAPIQWTWET